MTLSGDMTASQLAIMQQQRAMQSGGQANLMQSLLNCSHMHSQVYPAILQSLREAYMDHMQKPKEVLVMIDENGDVVE